MFGLSVRCFHLLGGMKHLTHYFPAINKLKKNLIGNVAALCFDLSKQIKNAWTSGRIVILRQILHLEAPLSVNIQQDDGKD